MLRSSEEQTPEFQSATPSAARAAPAAQTRVTPDELVAAVAALEQKREEQARELQGTLTLGEAVSELGLDATPEVLLAEVEAQRVKKAAAQAESDAAKARQNRADTGFAVPPTVSRRPPRVQSFLQETGFTRRRGRPKWVAIVFAVMLANVLAHQAHRITPVSVPTSHSIKIPNISITDHGINISTATYKTLAELPNGTTTSVSSRTLRQIKNGIAPSKISLQEVDGEDQDWEIVKYDGKVYVRIYAKAMSADDFKSASNLKVYSDNNSGELHHVTATGVTVPLDKLHWDGSAVGGDDYQQITVSNIALDEYANLVTK